MIIFHDDNDYKTFLDLILQIHRRYRFEIHAYCLIPNHYHILLCTPLANLSRGMRHIDGLYTQYYNRKYKKDGALFRGRYKSVLVDAKNYLLRLSRYIHLNPLNAGLVKHPSKYLWSSYQFYSKNITPPDWLYTKETLSYFGAKQQKNKYSLFIMEKTDRELENFYRRTKLLPILGSEIFRKQISQIILAENISTSDIPDQKNIQPQPDLVKICNLVAKHYHASIESLYNINYAKSNLPRTIAIYLAAELSGKKFKEIADFFKKISVTGISQIVLRTNKLRLSNPSANNDFLYNPEKLPTPFYFTSA